MTETSNMHIAVVGAGPGGYAAAFLAADLGMKVTLIDPELNPGGVCLYRGCIPSKALLHVAKLIGESQHAKNWGVEFGEPRIDVARLRSWKEDVVKKLTGGLGVLSKQRKVEYVQGRASFENSNTLRVARPNVLNEAKYTQGELSPRDLRVDTFPQSGSSVRVTHAPTNRVGTAKKRCACSVRDCTKWNCRSTVAESCCLLTASFWLRDHGQPSFPLSSSTLRA